MDCITHTVMNNQPINMSSKLSSDSDKKNRIQRKNIYIRNTNKEKIAHKVIIKQNIEMSFEIINT